MSEREWTGFEVAVIGMAGRFPGADSVAALWHNLVHGIEGIRRLEPDDLRVPGRDEQALGDPAFVPAHGVLDGHDQFDAAFFGLRAGEAAVLDPQQRLFLEVAWQAIEDAGIDAQRAQQSIGVFAGSSADHYLYDNVRRNAAALGRSGEFMAAYSNLGDHLAPRVSYKLDLGGPSVVVQTACSTSLVALHLAAQSLITGGCDVALAGGVSLTLPQHWGYRFEEGMILSPDGHCRAFDADAQGCLKGDGVGVVVLKRLADALADGDRVDAVILGSATNNDGAAKVGYTAPGLDGQVRVIAAALAMAGIAPDDIGYIETHGTGTPLGDPIEIAALTQVFRRHTARVGYCGIGSIKTGIGHLDAAAGVAGFIKAVLALKHKTLPASLHFERPNPALELDSSPFQVVARTRPWQAGAGPRRAGVSSFGIGGSNAHVVLQEAPVPAGPSTADTAPQLLVLSARSPAALDAMSARLTNALAAEPLALDAVAQTLLHGRTAFTHRRAWVASSAREAAALLRQPGKAVGGNTTASPSVVFLFPGQGAQYVNMGRGMYDHDASFRARVDDCAERLRQRAGIDLLPVLYPPQGQADDPALAERLKQTDFAQPALFVVEYALASWLIERGVQPAAVVGHSLGEFTAACVAGVFGLDDALELVALRGRLMQAQPTGAMLAVPLARVDLLPLLGDELSLAAENAPGLCVVAGPDAAVDALAQHLAGARGIETTRLHTSHAFHSSMMAPAVAPFMQALAAVPRGKLRLRWASSVTGGWVGEADRGGAGDREHWARNLRDTVRFGAAAQAVVALDNVFLLEVGPGATLTTLARRATGAPQGMPVATTLRLPRDDVADPVHLLRALGRLWVAGQSLKAPPGQARRRVALPTYAFERQRHWVDPDPPSALATAPRRPGVPGALHYQVPSWTRSALATSSADVSPGRWWLLAQDTADVQPLLDAVRDIGASFRVAGLETAGALESALAGEDAPDHLVVVAPRVADGGFAALLPLCRALALRPGQRTLSLNVVGEGAWSVLGDETVQPERVLPVGLTQVLPAEAEGVRARFIDIERGDPAWAVQVLAEARSGAADGVVAYRRGQRWRRDVETVALPRVAAGSGLRRGGVFVLTGGLGAIGLVLAESFARQGARTLVLVSRRSLPERAQWAEHVKAADREGALLEKLLTIEALGARVVTVAADIADAAAMAALRERLRGEVGVVHGIVHAAGVPGGRAIGLMSRDDVQAVFAAKVQGTRVLLDTFAGDKPDFVVLCSSLTSVVPRAGRAEYTAANLYLDAVAQAESRCRVISINWDNWVEGGMAAQGATAMRGLSAADGVGAFAQALTQRWPQLLVSTFDLRAPMPPEPAPQPTRVPAAVPAITSATTGGGMAAARALDAPRNRTEAKLVAIWQDLLGLPVVGIHDDFFELGGDSVVSIQLTSRARRAGLELQARQIFEHKTIAELALALGAAPAPVAQPTAAPAPAPTARPSVAGAPASHAPLLPIQRWFFGLPLQRPSHWNLSAWFEVSPTVTREQLAGALQAVVRRHEGLTARFDSAAATWSARTEATAEIELPRWTSDEVAAGETRLQAGLDLVQGPLLRCAWVEAEGTTSSRLLLVAHHLVADVIALRVLADELGQAAAQLAHGDAVDLGAGDTTLGAWSHALARHAASPAVLAELPAWRALADQPFRALPRDRADMPNTAGSAAVFTSSLDVADTRALTAWAARGGGAADVLGALAAALARATQAWAGVDRLWLDIEDHGRESFDAGLDAARIVGWLTTLYPLVVPALADAPAAAAEANRQLRALPQRGAGFGQLRHIGGDAVLKALPQPEVVLLYQGTLRPSRADAPLRLVQLGSPLCRAADDARSHLLELNARIDDGRLRVDWGYSTAVHDAATIAALAASFESALRKIAAPAAATREQQPTQVTTQAPMPLSFAQERLWFLQQLNTETNILNKQAVIELQGVLHTDALRAAFFALVQRHETLRTRFVRADGIPLQVVDEARPVAMPVIDVRDADRARQMCEQWVAAPFDLAAAPALRIGLLRLDAQRHWLVISLHHIVSDAWSFQVLLRELAVLYGAQLAGRRDPPLRPLPRRFAAHAQAQRQRLHAAALQPLIDFWRARLAGIVPLALPTDRPRPPVQQFAGGRVPFRWPAPLTQGLQALGRRHGASMFMTLLALYALLLQRYAAQDDIVIGSTAIDRPDVDDEGFIAPMINNLVLRTDLSGNPGFVELLARVRETVLSADEHRALPYDKLVEALAPQRDRSRSPLFQAMITFMNVPPALDAWPGLDVRAQEFDSHNAEFDLTLYAYDPGTGADAAVNGWIEYSTALFDRPTIERMAGHWQALAQAAVDDPTRGIQQLPLLSADEQAALRAYWQQPSAAVPADAGVHRLFVEQARRTPDAIALECDDDTLSYGELDRRSNRLARHLHSMGVGSDARGNGEADYVVVCADRSAAMVTALLAVHKAGAAYVSVDPQYPAERVAFMSRDCAAKVVVTQSDLAARMPAGVPQVLLDADSAAIERHSADDLDLAARSDRLAIVIYTSGSTGRPKGVQLEHGAVVNMLMAMREWPGIEAADRLLAVSSISFDLHILEIFLPLTCGATAVLATRDVTTDPSHLGRTLADKRITMMDAVPTIWRMLVESGWAGQPGLKILSGGEPMPVPLAEALLTRAAELWNLYGPTETTVYCSGTRLRDATELITVGHCIANLRALVLDRHGQPLPVGIPGELWIGGIGLARGYLNRPELTAERFRADPFGGTGRIYGSGDLVRQCADGRFVVVGRIDHQVKLRGHRIELGEIEHTLAQHPAIGRCVAMVREDTPGDQRLVAYAMRRERGDPAPTLSALREHAARSLPDYMLPAALVMLDDFPLTPNRKIDRRALPPPQPTGPAVQAHDAPEEPLSGAEKLVAGIFAEVLGRPRVSVDDNFFDLGGHSLLTMKVVERFEHATGLRMRPGELYQQSVGQIAAHYRDRIDGAEVVSVAPAAMQAPRGLTARVGQAVRQLMRRDPPR